MKRKISTLLYLITLLLTLFAVYCSHQAAQPAHLPPEASDGLSAAWWLERRMYAVLSAWAAGTAATVLLRQNPFERVALSVLFFCLYGLVAAFV